MKNHRRPLRGINIFMITPCFTIYIVEILSNRICKPTQAGSVICRPGRARAPRSFSMVEEPSLPSVSLMCYMRPQSPCLQTEGGHQGYRCTQLIKQKMNRNRTSLYVLRLSDWSYAPSRYITRQISLGLYFNSAISTV